MKIIELFDPKQASPLEWDYSTSGVAYASGVVEIGGHEVNIDITFSDMGNGIVNIEFMVGGSFELTGSGGASQVFATVIESVKQYVEENPKITTLTFTAEEKSRAKMYDTIAKRVAKQVGWHVVPHAELIVDPKFKTLISYGAYSFAIEKGHAPAHRQAAQKPQHGKWENIFFVYSFEHPEKPAIKLVANDGNEAENWVMKNVPLYKDEDPFAVFAKKSTPPEGRKIIDMGKLPPPEPKPPERVLSPLEQKLRDKLGEGYGNYWAKPKRKFTEMEIALMEGGHSLRSDNEETINSSSSSAGRMQFIKGLHSKPLGRESK